MAKQSQAEKLLDTALLKVESESIKEWVQSQRNIWVKIAQLYVNKSYSGKNTAVDALVVDIVSTAIGL